MKRSYNNSFSQKKMTSYAPTYARRPFKKVRADGSGLVPYGRSQLYTQKPYSAGIRHITKGLDTPIFPNNIVTDMATSDYVYPLNLIQAGTGSWNRIGRIIQMKSIRVRHDLKVAFSGAPPSVAGRSYRYLIVYDKQPNGTLPIKSEIIQTKNQSGTETGKWNGFLAYDTMQRFTILRDETIVINCPFRAFASTGAETGTVVVDHHHETYIKLNQVTNYKSESTPCTIADISTGALYLILLTDQSAATTNLLDTEVNCRLRYLDQ